MSRFLMDGILFAIVIVLQCINAFKVCNPSSSWMSSRSSARLIHTNLYSQGHDSHNNNNNGLAKIEIKSYDPAFEISKLIRSFSVSPVSFEYQNEGEQHVARLWYGNQRNALDAAATIHLLHPDIQIKVDDTNTISNEISPSPSQTGRPTKTTMQNTQGYSTKALTARLNSHSLGSSNFFSTNKFEKGVGICPRRNLGQKGELYSKDRNSYTLRRRAHNGQVVSERKTSTYFKIHGVRLESNSNSDISGSSIPSIVNMLADKGIVVVRSTCDSENICMWFLDEVDAEAAFNILNSSNRGLTAYPVSPQVRGFNTIVISLTSPKISRVKLHEILSEFCEGYTSRNYRSFQGTRSFTINLMRSADIMTIVRKLFEKRHLLGDDVTFQCKKFVGDMAQITLKDFQNQLSDEEVVKQVMKLVTNKIDANQVTNVISSIDGIKLSFNNLEAARMANEILSTLPCKKFYEEVDMQNEATSDNDNLVNFNTISFSDLPMDTTIATFCSRVDSVMAQFKLTNYVTEFSKFNSRGVVFLQHKLPIAKYGVLESALAKAFNGCPVSISEQFIRWPRSMCSIFTSDLPAKMNETSFAESVSSLLKDKFRFTANISYSGNIRFGFIRFRDPDQVFSAMQLLRNWKVNGNQICFSVGHSRSNLGLEDSDIMFRYIPMDVNRRRFAADIRARLFDIDPFVAISFEPDDEFLTAYLRFSSPEVAKLASSALKYYPFLETPFRSRLPNRKFVLNGYSSQPKDESIIKKIARFVLPGLFGKN